MHSIDLNSDVAESFGTWRLGDDAGILASVTSANIACGFHGGDPVTLQRAIAIAAERGIAVGAHIGYRDLAGFGRRYIAYSREDLFAETVYQLGALAGMARIAGAEVRYVKPHGALGHAVVHDEDQARAVVDAVAAYDPGLALLLMPNSVAVDYARASGLRVVLEAFADRNYLPNGDLVPRSHPDAVLRDTPRVVDNMLRFAEEGRLIALDGTVVELEAESICVHGDTAGAIEMAREVRRALEHAGIEIRSFA